MIEIGGHFIVLFIRLVCFNRERGLVDLLQVFLGQFRIFFTVFNLALLESFFTEVTDACPDEKVGHPSALAKLNKSISQAHQSEKEIIWETMGKRRK